MVDPGWQPPGRPTRKRRRKAKWTVTVYMAGDNNLDSAALRDISEMAKVGYSEKGRS